MSDGSRNPEEPPERVTLLCLNETFWMHEGEEFIDAVLSKNGYYPTPVRCVVFSSAFEMQEYRSSRLPKGELWTVHSAIVARLRADGELVEINASAG
ncbi:MAG: hypothetical protein AAFR47_19660 [Pseudomonadota bacterium]